MVVGKVAEKVVVEDRSRLENDRLVEEELLVSALECPVCLTLPHSAPVYTCRVSQAKSDCDVSVVFVKKKLFANQCAVVQCQLPMQVFQPRSGTVCVGAAGKVFSNNDARFVSQSTTGRLVSLS